MIVLVAACVLDRTGQSATAAYERELALQANRVTMVSDQLVVVERRVAQLEEVTRYQGQKEAEKLENIDQIRAEVQRLRGALEETQHAAEQASRDRTALDEDLDFRADYLEARVAAMEKALGMKPPPPPVSGSGATVDAGTGEVKLPEGPPQEVELPSSPEEKLALAETHLTEGRPVPARVVLEGFLREHADDPRANEARYRLAESYFNNAEYQKAILVFEDVVTADPKGQWASWAKVRQGECFARLGKNAEARLFWQDAIATYPKSKAAKEAKTLMEGLPE